MSNIPHSLNSMRILHIDDSLDDREMVKLSLEGLDPEMGIVSAASPTESLRMMEELQIDCIVCDYSMPEMNGIELCRRIRETSDVPFIMYTGRGSEEVASIAFEAGADDYIRKEPGQGHFRVLANRVRQAVEKHWGDGLYRNVLENTRDSIIIAQGTRIVYANQATADLVGVSSVRELLETDALDWILKKDRRRIQSIVLGRQRGESHPPRFEIEFQRSDGERRILEVSSSLIHNKGRPASLSVIRDVSDKVRVRERLAALHNCTLRLASAESIEEIAKQTLDSIEEVFDFRWGDISILEDGRLIQVYFKGVTYVDFETLSIDGPGVVTRAARTGESQLVHDTRADTDYLPAFIDDDKTTLSELAVPIKENGSVIGVLNLESPVLNGFSADDQRLLEIFSRYVASAIVRIRNEGLLKTSEEKYRNILESSLDGVTVTKDTKIVFANQSFAEMIGCEDPSELLGKSSWDVVAPEFQALIQERRNKRREGDRSTFRYDMTFVGKDGAPFYIESQTSPIEFEGEPAVLGVHRDINERKRLDAELRDSEARWRSMVKLAPDGIITLNPLGFVTSINDVFVELTGFSKDEIVGKHFSKMETLRARDMPTYVRLFAALLKGKTPPPHDFEYRRKDGSMGWGQAHMRSIKVGDTSREILVILREISERKRLEDELRESEERHRTLVELSPQGIMVIDSEGYVRTANPAVEKLHGFSSREIVGKHFTELPQFNNSDLPQYQEGFKSIMEGKSQPSYEYKLTHKDGTERWAVANIGVLKNKGRIDGFLTVINDITERKLMEEALRVNQERFKAFMESCAGHPHHLRL